MYFDNTFQLLHAIAVNPLARKGLVVLPDISYKSIPMTKNTTELLFVVFQASVISICHWVMTRIALVGAVVQSPA